MVCIFVETSRGTWSDMLSRYHNYKRNYDRKKPYKMQDFSSSWLNLDPSSDYSSNPEAGERISLPLLKNIAHTEPKAWSPSTGSR